MELAMLQKQTQTLSPQMMQSMEILQMGAQDLLDYIMEAVAENPVLEPEEQHRHQDEFTLLKRKLEWLESTDVQNSYYQRQDEEDDADPMTRYGGVTGEEENLYLYVLSQLKMAQQELEPEVYAASVLLVESLNQNGWLDEALEEISAELGTPLKVLNRALAEVQSLEPAGVGARDLGECLRLQLERRVPVNDLAVRIATSYLDPLSKNRYHLISKELGAPSEEVHAACALIRDLNPRPGTGFATREHLAYINPDLFVLSFPDHFELLSNDYFYPTLNLSGYYIKLFKESDDASVREYLADKVRQAKWVVRSIDQRRSTLADCARCILELQESFFHKGPGYLRPLSLCDVAQRLEIHESTVSRAVRDKYLQCSFGVYPLSYFFSRALGTGLGECSPDSAKARLKKLVDGEDRQRPLSDQKLCARMAEEGCTLSRRTVAKYRDELGIPSAAGRKQLS